MSQPHQDSMYLSNGNHSVPQNKCFNLLGGLQDPGGKQPRHPLLATTSQVSTNVGMSSHTSALNHQPNKNLTWLRCFFVLNAPCLWRTTSGSTAAMTSAWCTPHRPLCPVLGNPIVFSLCSHLTLLRVYRRASRRVSLPPSQRLPRIS